MISEAFVQMSCLTSAKLFLPSREQSYMESVVTFLQDVVPQVNVFTFYFVYRFDLLGLF